MKITIKTLQQKVFQVEADGSDTVLDVKKKVQEAQGHPVDNQKLIYSGKVLPDSKTVESCEIKEKDFLVLMVSKPKASSAAPAASTSSTTPSTPGPAPSSSSEPPAPAPAPPAAPAAPAPGPVLPPPDAAPLNPPVGASAAAVAPAAPPQFGDMSSFLTGDALQSSINNMVDMGFPREQVLRAMRASFNNPDRAVDYLMSGIPAHLEAEAAGHGRVAGAGAGAAAGGAPAPAQPAQQAPQPAAQAPAAAGAAPAGPQNLFQLAQQQQQQAAHPGAGALGGGGGGGAGALDLSALRDNPQIAQLRNLVAENPEMIQPILQQLAHANPGLAQMLANNPEALLQLLAPEGGFGDFGEGEGEGGLPPGAHVVNVTPEERAAIERLEGLGFPRQMVIEAYFACDKNEELAANFLFENGFEE
ncbi:hypothetical protein JAAARDRAFT_37302 [Jaapia argillacea MUCL 33604]|uniref:UV excision repair protein RAD23 n=1 Tax=Jaapia argillacea MUCL 33604 TaxID=933084 RepID=A0A067PLT1_9AGAM|nr:hypothetical protein JAAARDRAFT_37302 [Jaapia argillacea MUCL 33604]